LSTFLQDVFISPEESWNSITTHNCSEICCSYTRGYDSTCETTPTNCPNKRTLCRQRCM